MIHIHQIGRIPRSHARRLQHRPLPFQFQMPDKIGFPYVFVVVLAKFVHTKQYCDPFGPAFRIGFKHTYTILVSIVHGHDSWKCRVEGPNGFVRIFVDHIRCHRKVDTECVDRFMDQDFEPFLFAKYIDMIET